MTYYVPKSSFQGDPSVGARALCRHMVMAIRMDKDFKDGACASNNVKLPLLIYKGAHKQ